MCRLKHRRLWHYWLGSFVGTFAVMEYPAIKHKCHQPLSRVLSDLRLGPALIAGGIALGVHVIRYPGTLNKENPRDDLRP